MLFNSDATNLVAGDTNGVGNLFLRDLLTNAVIRLTQTSGSYASISDDGRLVAYASFDDSIVRDIFVHESNFAYACQEQVATTIGTGGNDTLTGTEVRNVIARSSLVAPTCRARAS